MNLYKRFFILSLILFFPLPLYAVDSELLYAFKEQKQRYQKEVKKWKKISHPGRDGKIYLSAKTMGQLTEKYLRRHFEYWTGKIKSQGDSYAYFQRSPRVFKARYKGKKQLTFTLSLATGLKGKKSYKGRTNLRLKATLKGTKANGIRLKLKVARAEFKILKKGKKTSLPKISGLIARKAKKKFESTTLTLGPLYSKIPLRLDPGNTVEIPLQISFQGLEGKYAAFALQVAKKISSESPLPELLTLQDRSDPLQALAENEERIMDVTQIIQEVQATERKALSAGGDVVVELRPTLALSLARKILPQKVPVGTRELRGIFSLFQVRKTSIDGQEIRIVGDIGFLINHLDTDKFPILAPVFPSVKGKKVRLTIDLRLRLTLPQKKHFQASVKAKILKVKISDKKDLSSSIIARSLREALNLFLRKRIPPLKTKRARIYLPLFYQISRRADFRLFPEKSFSTHERLYFVLESQPLRRRSRFYRKNRPSGKRGK